MIDKTTPVKYKFTTFIDKTTSVKYKITTLIDKTTPVKYKITMWTDTTTPVEYKITAGTFLEPCSSGLDRGFETGRITQNVQLVLVASPLSTQN
jgi:hypothetical protein